LHAFTHTDAFIVVVDNNFVDFSTLEIVDSSSGSFDGSPIVEIARFPVVDDETGD
jgi:hypothetical protein